MGPVTVRLTEHEERLLRGEAGRGAQTSMRIVVEMAEICEAAALLEVSQAHIDGCGLLSDAGVEFAEKLVSEGARVAVPTTLNMGPLDLQQWRSFGVDAHFARKAIRQGAAYEKMGCVPTWTCAPYQGYLTPRFGAQIAWGESNAVAYANSVLGARTNRYADYMDICAAIVGRVPASGLHLAQNRRGQVVLNLPEVNPVPEFYPVLGHFVGGRAGDRVPVVAGLRAAPNDDELKAFCAAVASAGSVALFHIVGVTPEAPTLEAALQGAEPEEVVDVTRDDLLLSFRDLSSAEAGTPLDCVIVGCPHYSYHEFRALATLIERHAGVCSPNVAFIVATGQQSYSLVQRQPELLKTLTGFGARITLDTCAFHSPIVRKGTRTVMTDSGKCAYYAPGELGVQLAFGTMAECVASAILGKVVREEPKW